jgi:predicted small integral membrane protein
MWIRLCQTALVAAIALLMGLVAFNNLVDYDGNWQFVRHVTAMDSIFAGSAQHWRAIGLEPLQRTAYGAIIATQLASAVLLTIGAVLLARGVRSNAAFRAASPLAVVGLTVVMLLYGAGFLGVGAEWFLMWQSSSWNGSMAAGRFFLVAAAVLLILLSGPRSDDS